jgi:hypothetical protein
MQIGAGATVICISWKISACVSKYFHCPRIRTLLIEQLCYFLHSCPVELTAQLGRRPPCFEVSKLHAIRRTNTQ